MKLNHPEDNLEETNFLVKNKAGANLFFIEKLGFFIILVSGIMPFVHSFVKHKVLEEKLFGFTSVHLFLYSLGVHLCAFFLVIGVLMIISVANNPTRYKIIQHYLRYALISPFVSGVFYLSWIFIPDVNYNLLAYVFLSLLICVISLFIFRSILNYINTLKNISKHKEDILNDGMSYLKSKLNK